MKLNKMTRLLSLAVFLVGTNLFAGAHALVLHGPNGPAGAVVGTTPGGRHFAVAGIKTGGRRGFSYYDSACYNPYLSYWSYYPASSYYNGSFGYWGSSYGAYGSYYTQPGLFTSYLLLHDKDELKKLFDYNLDLTERTKMKDSYMTIKRGSQIF